MEKDIKSLVVNIDATDPEHMSTVCKQIQSLLLEVLGTGNDGRSLRKRINNTQLDNFLSTQDSFAYNLCGRLAVALEQLGDQPESDDRNKAIEETLFTIQGVCLVHRPSRLVFNTTNMLELLLGFCQVKNDSLQVVGITTLCAIMVRQVENIRRFEKLGGLKVVTDIFKHRNTAFTVKRAILEFLFFYLVPETKFQNQDQYEVPRRTTAAKQIMLGKYLSNVDGLVRELEVNKPFGNMDLEW